MRKYRRDEWIWRAVISATLMFFVLGTMAYADNIHKKIEKISVIEQQVISLNKSVGRIEKLLDNYITTQLRRNKK